MKNIFKKVRGIRSVKKQGKIVLTLTLLVILLSNILLQDASLFESKAYDNTEKALPGESVDDSQWKEKVDKLTLTGDGSGRDVLAVAVSQIGYEAAETVDANGETQYYSMYGNAYEQPYAPWNTAFMAYCLNTANVSKDTFPVKLVSEEWIQALKDAEILLTEGQPEAGDLVFFHIDKDATDSYVGIVSAVTFDADGTVQLKVVVGDYERKVQEISYNAADITGYAKIAGTTEPVVEEKASGKKEEPKTAADTKAATEAKAPMDMSLQAAVGAPGTLTTEDSLADGIVLNLFDYDGAGKNLDVSNNIVDNPVYAGINMDGNNRREFLFLGQGEHNRTYYGDDLINVYTNGTIARQNIVKNTLGNDGYPVLNTQRASSLAYLFNPNLSVKGKTTYANVNHLFTKDADGYYEYNSDRNYAYFDKNTKNFTVYNGTYNNDEGQPIGFFPFNEYNRTKQNVHPEGNYYNHHFGLSMDIDFLLSRNKQVNGKDMTFRFSGDDDVWVFIDGVKVLDIGGIHERTEGSINFRKGEVYVSRAIDKNVSNNEEREAKAVRTTIAELFRAAGKTYDNADWSKHNLKFYYLERGGCYSNNWIKFNLPTGLQIAKKISGEDTSDYMNKDYYFKLYVETAVGSGKYEVYTNNNNSGSNAFYNDNDSNKVIFDNNGIFKMKANQTVNILNINAHKRYYIEEVDIDGNVITGVSIDSLDAAPVLIDEGKKIYKVISTKKTILERNSIVFDNKLKEEFKDITIKKNWLNSDGSTKKEDLPASIKVDLYRKCKDGTGRETDEKLKTIELNAQNGWKHTESHMLTARGEKTYTYYVKEVTVMGYSGSISSSTDNNGNITFTLTNKENPFDIKVVKNWFKPDGSKKEDGLPVKIMVTLYRSTTKTNSNASIPADSKVVAEVELSNRNNWSYTWTDKDLEAYDAVGNPYYYYVKESTLEEYITTYENNQGVASTDENRTIVINNTCKYVENISIPSAGGLGFTMFTLTGMFCIVLMCLVYIVSKMQKGGVAA